jgi:hypothetical protein
LIWSPLQRAFQWVNLRIPICSINRMIYDCQTCQARKGGLRSRGAVQYHLKVVQTRASAGLAKLLEKVSYWHELGRCSIRSVEQNREITGFSNADAPVSVGLDHSVVRRLSHLLSVGLRPRLLMVRPFQGHGAPRRRRLSHPLSVGLRPRTRLDRRAHTLNSGRRRYTTRKTMMVES